MSYESLVEQHISADVSVLEEWAETLTLIASTGATYNTTTGVVTQPSAQTGLSGVFYNVRQSRVDGINILSGDKEVLIQWSGMTEGADPRPDDIIVNAAGTKFLVKDVRPIANAHTWLLRVRP